METGLSLNELMARPGGESGIAAPSPPSADERASRAGGPGNSGGGALGDDLEGRMQAIAERLQEFVRESRRRLEFQVDRSSGEVVILVHHAESGKLLRTIPPEEARALADRMTVGEAALLSRRA